MSDEKDKPRNTGTFGCLLLIPIMILFDVLGMTMGSATPLRYGPVVVVALALLGFVCGMALGIYSSAKSKPSTAASREVWLVYGLAGMAIPTLIAFCILRLTTR